MTVPFTLGGTAASGIAFSGVTASPLMFGIGQTTQDITGKLLSDPGPSQTLTFTLGTPTGGAALGSPSVNTLTITEPAAGTPTPRRRPRRHRRRRRQGPGASVFLGEQRVFSDKGKHQKVDRVRVPIQRRARRRRGPIDRRLSRDPEARQEGQGAPGQVRASTIPATSASPSRSAASRPARRPRPRSRDWREPTGRRSRRSSTGLEPPRSSRGPAIGRARAVSRFHTEP